MLLKALREGLGRLFIGISNLSLPQQIMRSEEKQQAADAEASKMALYQFYACPFCLKVRRAIHRLNVPIETRDAQNDPNYRQELLTEGGEIKVPCLRIEEEGGVKWLYESDDIIAYLERTFVA
jgi:glutaredoxin